MDEFDLIKRYFATRTLIRPDVVISSGDDCAIVSIAPEQQLALSMDTLISGVHFPINTSAFDIGYKSLAVNLSDLAAMGAEPAWATLSLTLVDADTDWLDHFSQGFFSLAQQFNVQLIGGDITRGSVLSITIQVHGFIPAGKSLPRDGAKIGDAIYVTGSLGDAGLALQLLKSAQPVPNELLMRLNRPTPRIAVGLALRDIAHSAIDISDGLVADLSHILERSDMGATVNLQDIPLSSYLIQNINTDCAIELALTAGDDYELCFTAPVANEQQLKLVMQNLNCPLHKIGVIENQRGLRVIKPDGTLFNMGHKGYLHF